MAVLDAGEVLLDQPDRATMEFIKTLKAHTTATLSAALAARVDAEAERRRDAGASPLTVEEVAALVSPDFRWQADRFIARQTQEMMWTRLFEATSRHAAELLAWLDEPVPQPLGSLTLDPALEIPAYFEVEYHIQPGGMHRQPLIPFVLATGQVVYHAGRNDRWALKRSVAEMIPDGAYERILDMACGIGQSIIPIKERFPAAEVYGIDLAAPLLKYAHKLAEHLGLALHLSQQNAEQTTFPDNWFDVVTSCILFHEIPDEAAYNVIAEGYRLTKPGGYFQIGDTVPYRHLDPFRRFSSDWQTEHNGEPYWRQAGLRDYPALLRAAGFCDIEERPTRAGLWVTSGRKRG
ncbi:MAG: class I SAM-dependent methyltransferase [Chloroflexota bacterium]|nr:class I SAM-dependent methyltransferase [Dehalococcoidia bacterium]MDW8252836.1 class I SAM-dependent methyltransferase [Chloroflexota bacterium]